MLLAAAGVVGAVIYNMPNLNGSTSGTTPPAATSTTAGPVSATDPAIIDAAFAGTIRSDDPALSKYSDDQLVQTGKQICSDIRSGTSVKDEATLLMTQYPARDAGVILEVAPDAYCKDLKAGIEQQIAALR